MKLKIDIVKMDHLCSILSDKPKFREYVFREIPGILPEIVEKICSFWKTVQWRNVKIREIIIHNGKVSCTLEDNFDVNIELGDLPCLAT